MEVKYIGDYDLIGSIAYDCFSETYLAEHRFLKKEVVMKINDDLPESSAEYFISVYSKIDHPNLICPLLIEKEEGKVFFVYEPYLNQNHQPLNLLDLMAKSDSLSEEIVLRILSQVASALDYIRIHELGFANLKPSNILFRNDNKEGFSVGLIDFLQSTSQSLENLSIKMMDDLVKIWSLRSEESKEDLLTKYEMNKAFIASEVHRKNCDKNALNTYAFGVLAYFLLTKSVPVLQFNLISTKQNYSLNWDFLIEQCFQVEPSDRPKNLLYLLETIGRKIEQTSKKEQPKIQEFIAEMQKNPAIKIVEQVNTGELKPVLKAQELVRPTFDPDPAQIFHGETIIAPYRPKERELAEISPIDTEMLIIPEGEYIRGSNEGARDERPAHKIFLDSFAMDIHPVTNEQFVRFLEAMGGEKDSNNNDLVRLRESRIKRSAGKLIIESGYAKHPVVGVSWYGALGYAKWVGKRLPTEAEWEVASRSLKSDPIYPTGLNIERIHANFFSADTTPVMSYPPIDIGLYDMAGNVYEWCHDWYDYNYYENSLQEPTNPKGPNQGVYRVLKGGCWKSLKDDLRCSHRHRNNPGTVNKTYGFRCAADVAPA